MKRVSNNTSVAVLAWVVALALPLGPGVAPEAGADDTDLGAAPAAMADAPAPEKTADASAEKPAPVEKPEPVDEPGPTAVEKPVPPGDPSPEPAGSEAGTPPAQEPGDGGSPAGAPPETPSAASPSATPDIAAVVDGSQADLVSPAAEPQDPAIPGAGLPAGLEEIPAEAAIGPLSIAPSDLCAIGDTGYATLDAAIAAAVSGQTITVLKSLTHASPVVVDGKNLTFDLDEGSITIDTSGSTGTTALLVKNAIVTLTGGGHIDVSGALAGVRAENGRIAVRYAIALWGSGAYALNGGDITVRGDAKGFAVGALAFGAGSTVTVGDDAMATGDSGRGAEAVQGGQVTAKNALAMVNGGTGASAYRGGTVTIARQATGIAYGATAYETGVVTVGGDVAATGGSGVGAWAHGGGKITIDGGLAGTTYLKVGDVGKDQGDAEPATTLPGYRTYLDGTSTVWVKGAPLAANVCAIGAQEFPTLDEALAKVDGTASAPTVIRLLTSIDHDRTLAIGSRHVVFDLDGFNLMVDGGGQAGLKVAGGTVGYAGSGAFGIAGSDRVVEATAGGRATVTGIRILADHVFGAFAGGDGSRIVVNGDIRTEGEQDSAVGAYATGEGLVTVDGAIWIQGGNGTGARADWGSKVTVRTSSGEAITVLGDYAVAASPHYGGEVVVGGDLVASGADAAGVLAPGGIARINGDVTAMGAWSVGAASSDDGQVRVTGEVTVSGAKSIGIAAHVGEGSGGTVEVTGSVIVTGDEALGVEAYSRSGGNQAEWEDSDWIGKSLVTIRGQLSAPEYLLVDDQPRTIDSRNGEDSSGFWLYLGPHGSRVRIGNGQPTLRPPAAVTKPVTGITATAANLSGEVTSDGGAPVGERGFVYSTSPDPTLANGTKVLAGSGTGAYAAALSGLRAGTGYYVRAYAINSEGTGYGGTQPFVTPNQPAVDPTPTPTPEPSESADPAPTPTPEPSDTAHEPSESDELPVTGAGERQLGWLLGLMAATVLGGLVILLGKGHALRHRE